MIRQKTTTKCELTNENTRLISLYLSVKKELCIGILLQIVLFGLNGICWPAGLHVGGPMLLVVWGLRSFNATLPCWSCFSYFPDFVVFFFQPSYYLLFLQS
jgi:hypothetical protein